MCSDISLPYQEQICDGNYDDDADDDNANNTDGTDEERVERRKQY